MDGTLLQVGWQTPQDLNHELHFDMLRCEAYYIAKLTRWHTTATMNQLNC